MGLSEDLFRAISKVTDDVAAEDPGFVDRAQARVNEMEEHERVAFDLSRFFAQQSVLQNDKRLHYASMATLFMSGILEGEEGLTEMSLIDMMDFADDGWSAIEDAISQAINSMWEAGDVD